MRIKSALFQAGPGQLSLVRSQPGPILSLLLACWWWAGDVFNSLFNISWKGPCIVFDDNEIYFERKMRRWCHSTLYLTTLIILFKQLAPFMLIYFDQTFNHIWTKDEVGAPLNQFKPSSKNIFTDHSRAVLLLWIIYVISVLILLCFHARLFVYALWSPAGKGLTSFQLVSWVRCGAWLYNDSWSLPSFLLFLIAITDFTNLMFRKHKLPLIVKN